MNNGKQPCNLVLPVICLQRQFYSFAVTVLSSAVPVSLALGRGFCLHSASLSDKRSYLVGASYTPHTAPASQPADRRTAQIAGPPSGWACRPKRQRLFLPPHVGQSQPHVSQEISSCAVISDKRRRPPASWNN